MNSNHATPYVNLTPDLILDAVESVGFVCNGSLLALNSYENRVYQVGIEEGSPLIAKFYRPERWTDACILEEHQFSDELVAQEIPVIAPLKNSEQKTLHDYQGYRFALFTRWGGRALELDNLEQLEWMGRFIGRMHAVSATRDFQHRPTLNIQTHGINAYQFVLEKNFIPDSLKKNYCSVVETALQKIGECFKRASPIKNIRVHGDIHPGNVLWDGQGPHIVDLDDCVMAPAMQDIWMLLSGDKHQQRSQLDTVLEGYQDFHDFNFRELHLIEALRTLRQLMYSGWLAKRWEDPAFPRHFPWFNTPHYWQEQIQNLQQQIYAMEEILK